MPNDMIARRTGGAGTPPALEVRAHLGGDVDAGGAAPTDVRWRALATLARTVVACREPGAVAERLADAAAVLVGVPAAAIFEVEGPGAAPTRVASVVRDPRVASADESRFDSAIAATLDTAWPAWQRAESPLAVHGPGEGGGGRDVAVLAFPLTADERVIGALVVADRGERVYGADDLAIATAVADLAAAALDNARLHAALTSELGTLRASQDRVVATERLHAIGDLASGVAHHLNNIFTVILGNTQCALRRSPPSDTGRNLRTVEAAVLEAAELVRRLGTFSRSRPASADDTLDLNALVSDVVELTRVRWHDEAQMRGITIEARVERGAVPPVKADELAIREVILNLVLNAIDALPQGGHIVLRTWADDQAVHCSVSDDGVGMPLEIRQRALEPFFTTKGPGSRGLGLSVAYGNMQRHSGSLVIESVEGQGTTVRLSLPTRVAAPDAPKRRATSRQRSILLIDDDTLVRDVLAELLSDDGHHVVQADTGQAAMRHLENGERFDIVITDLGMPGMNGWDVIRAVKLRDPSIPTILITGWGERPMGQPADVHPDAILAKPVTEQQLRSAVELVMTRPA